MTRSTKLQLLYTLLGLFILASMTYYVMAATAVYQRFLQVDRHPRNPFSTGTDEVSVETVTAEASAAGLRVGDRLVDFNGTAYTGQAQWIATLGGGSGALRVHETLPVKVRRGTAELALEIPLVSRELPAVRLVMTGMLVQLLPPLVCLLVGYWVAWARPDDPKAWLILVLMTLMEVLFDTPRWWPGIWVVPLGTWYATFQMIGPLALLLFGVSFPERWRVDAKLPWAKWILIAPILIAYPVLLWIAMKRYYDVASLGPGVLLVDSWLDRILNPLNLVCVVVYWAAILDKLRSVENPDARRRLRVLFAGSVIGLGSLLLIFVLLPHFYPDPKKTQAVNLIGALLVLTFPFSLAYVVLVQRALDVRIIVRMGTRYALAKASIVVMQIAIAALVFLRILLPFFKRQHDLSVVVPVTVLAIAVFVRLFMSRNSLSEWLQKWLDRKFFREAYDAEIVLSELSEQARSFTEAGPLIDTITRRISEVLHVQEVAVFLRGGHVFQMQRAVGLPLEGSMQLHESSSTVRNLARSNRPATLYREDPDGWFLLADARERQTLDQLGAELLLPLAGRDRLLGLMTLGPKRSQEPFSPTDLRLLQSVSTQTGLALEISELIHSLARQASERQRIDREIEIAREVQERLFPQEIPVIPGVTLAGACRPAQGVGGDYYDFIPMENGQLGLAIGDISGKGISAALLMASLRASLRGVTMDDPTDLARVMEKVNRLVYEASASNRYATFFFATFDPRSRVLRYVNAGHNSPIVVRDGSSFTLDGGGPVVGLLKDVRYEEQEVQLRAGDVLIGYTDGISEAMTHKEEEWGEERMIAAASCMQQSGAAEILKCVFEEADAFTAGAPQHDDMTLLLMKLQAALPADEEQVPSAQNVTAGVTESTTA